MACKAGSPSTDSRPTHTDCLRRQRQLHRHYQLPRPQQPRAKHPRHPVHTRACSQNHRRQILRSPSVRPAKKAHLARARKGFLWASLDPQGNTAYYDWRTGRSHHDLLEVLGYDPGTGKIKFRGIIQCDGYSAYLAVVIRYPGIRLAACLAHIRRYFFDAKEQTPRVAKRILAKIQALYQIEENLRQREAPPDARKRERQEKSSPIVDEIKKQIDEEKSKHLPKSKLGEAISYTLNQWSQFEEYLEDGRLEIDNNLVENAIRPTKLGAKNWLFFGSAGAGENNALLYTLVENCKRQGLDSEDYLSEVIRRLPAEATAEQAAELTPAKVAAARAEAAEIQGTAAA
jgi:transposase